MKTDQCKRCLFYAKNPYLLCPVNPQGIEGEHCPDFQPDPNAEPEELWAPVGWRFEGDELVSNHED
jgi:hypothetical protein